MRTICDRNGNQLANGLAEHAAQARAQALANHRGESVWVFPGPTEVKPVKPPHITPEQFWRELDAAEASHKRGAIDTTQLVTEACLLGWRWHRDHGEGLPARPRDGVKP